MIEIDGSQGEGGGQIIRSCLTLSAITGKPFTITNVRAGRKKPGLLRQHLTATNAAQTICNGTTTGAELKSNHLSFKPGPIRGGDFKFSIGSAGSGTLVAQTVIPILMMAKSASSVEIEGGTHNPMAPCHDYLAKVYLPLIERMGPRLETSLERFGFYPAGGGKFSVRVHPSPLAGLTLTTRQGKYQPHVTAIVSSLAPSVGQRECDTIVRKMQWSAKCATVLEVPNPHGPGNVVMIEIKSDNVSEIFTGFGAVGVPAERVARNVLKSTKSYLGMETVPVGPYLADQLLLPMALAAQRGESSQFVTTPLTQHSLTQIDTIHRFLYVEIDVEIDVAEPGPRLTVTVQPKS
jgi:RNA 3'-terminal phosphate cyclase (ATP)